MTTPQICYCDTVKGLLDAWTNDESLARDVPYKPQAKPGPDKRVFGEGEIPDRVPNGPYATITELGGTVGAQADTAFFGRRLIRLRVYATCDQTARRIADRAVRVFRDLCFPIDGACGCDTVCGFRLVSFSRFTFDGRWKMHERQFDALWEGN